MDGWKTLHSFGFGPVLRHLGGHPLAARAKRGSQVVLSSTGVLALAAAALLALNTDWRAAVADRLTGSESAAELSVVTNTAAVTQPVEAAHVPKDGAMAAVRKATLAYTAAAWGALSKLPSVAHLAARIPVQRVVVDARSSGALASMEQQSAVATYIARKFRVANDATAQLVKAAFLTGKEVGVDPMLLLAVMAIESSFNPYAESGMGAQGLMQVMTKVHRDKYEAVGGVQAALNPYANIKIGALVLKDCIARAGSLEGGLKYYVGATTATDGGYGAKVLAERARLRQAAGISTITASTAKSRQDVKLTPVSTDATEAAGGNAVRIESMVLPAGGNPGGDSRIAAGKA